MTTLLRYNLAPARGKGTRNTRLVTARPGRLAELLRERGIERMPDAVAAVGVSVSALYDINAGRPVTSNTLSKVETMLKQMAPKPPSVVAPATIDLRPMVNGTPHQKRQRLVAAPPGAVRMAMTVRGLRHYTEVANLANCGDAAVRNLDRGKPVQKYTAEAIVRALTGAAGPQPPVDTVRQETKRVILPMHEATPGAQPLTAEEFDRRLDAFAKRMAASNVMPVPEPVVEVKPEPPAVALLRVLGEAFRACAEVIDGALAAVEER